MALITPLKGSDGAQDKGSLAPARTVDDGPPPSQNKPKSQPKGSLFQQNSRDITTQNSMGLGAEGGSPQVLANQALAQVLSGVKILSTVLPGLVPVLSDLTGRLTMLVPQMMNDFTNGGSGLVPVMGMPLPQPSGPAPGMPPGGMPPGPLGAPPMGPQGAPPMPPPMPNQ